MVADASGATGPGTERGLKLFSMMVGAFSCSILHMYAERRACAYVTGTYKQGKREMKITLSDAQRQAAIQLAKELPHAATIAKLRAMLKPLLDTGAFDKPWKDEESGLILSAKISRSLNVEAA